MKFIGAFMGVVKFYLLKNWLCFCLDDIFILLINVWVERFANYFIYKKYLGDVTDIFTKF